MKLAYLYGIDSANGYLSTYSHYPVTKNISFVSEIKYDKPLLIVGIKKAKQLYPNQIDLDNNYIEKNIYWCYSPEEYLSEFLKKYEEFILNIHNIYLNLIEFEIIDIFFTRLHNKNNLLEFLRDSDINTFYQLNKILYSYSKTKNKIFIINLNEFFWFNLINIDEYAEFVKKLDFYYDSNNKIFNYFTNLFLGQDNFLIEKTIPYFIYLKHQNKH